MPFSESSEEHSVESDSSLAYDTLAGYDSSVSSLSDVINPNSSSGMYDDDEPNEIFAIDQTGRSATDSAELCETTESSTKKRKISAEDKEVERILKGSVSVVLKRIRFDENSNEWILPENRFTILSEDNGITIDDENVVKMMDRNDIIVPSLIHGCHSIDIQ